MGKFISNFDTTAEFAAFSATTAYSEPHVTLIKENDEVKFITPPPLSEQYLTFIPVEDTTFSFSRSTGMCYSLDNGSTWTELTGTPTPTVRAKEKIMWKSEIEPAQDSGIGYFSSNKLYDIQGNIMSLLFGDNFVGQTSLSGKNYAFFNTFRQNVRNAKKLILPATTLSSNCYQGMFAGCTLLTTAPELPATTLGYQCYDGMFRNCSLLTKAPELPATALTDYCYSGMFQGCTSLTTAPELPATTLGSTCYWYMFMGCTSLTTAPELPATTLRQVCYSRMFAGCTSLTTAPVLSATTLANSCYSEMFSGCTSLTTAPELPTTNLMVRCYKSMFQGCTSLTTAPELPATTLTNYCYQNMFSGCTSLNYIKCDATNISATSCTSNWVSGVASSGDFYGKTAASWTTSDSGIPSNWTQHLT